MQIVIPRNESFGKFVLFATEEACLEHDVMYENRVQWKTETKKTCFFSNPFPGNVAN